MQVFNFPITLQGWRVSPPCVLPAPHKVVPAPTGCAHCLVNYTHSHQDWESECLTSRPHMGVTLLSEFMVFATPSPDPKAPVTDLLWRGGCVCVGGVMNRLGESQRQHTAKSTKYIYGNVKGYPVYCSNCETMNWFFSSK